MSKTGRFAIIEQLLADGFEYMFGNPGTSEEGFLDARSDKTGLKYILTLQESIAVLIADGYSRAGNRPALVQLHSSPGIGNGVGAVYQAMRGHAPLVIIGGDAGIKYQNMDAQMAADLVAIMEPVTKYSVMALHKDSLLRTLRRCVKMAATPPSAPVYICLPMDVLDEENAEDVYAGCIPSTRVKPEQDILESAAQMLAGAERPVIFFGDGIAKADAQWELQRVAELLGAEVYGVDAGDLSMDHSHPLYMGTTGHMFGKTSLPITQKGDVNLIVGTYMVPEVFPETGDIFAKNSKIIHFDLNACEIAKNHRVDLAAISDPQLSLAGLADVLERILDQKKKDAARARTEKHAAKKSKEMDEHKALDEQSFSDGKLNMAFFSKCLAEQIPENTIIFDEALTSSPELTRYLAPRKPGSYFVTRGGSLGVGIPGAIGIKLAKPDACVIGFTGDGGSMYTIQALWTAAHHRIDAKFVICNNHSYKLLKLNILEYWKEWKIENRNFPGEFDLHDPEIDFVALAQGLGVPGMRVNNQADVNEAIEKMLAEPGPYLLDLILPRSV